jgi:hypothetical protein
MQSGFEDRISQRDTHSAFVAKKPVTRPAVRFYFPFQCPPRSAQYKHELGDVLTAKLDALLVL